MPDAGCKRFVDDFLTRVRSGESRLDGTCVLADLDNAYDFDVGTGRASRGELQIEYIYRTLARPGFVDPIFFYFRDDRLCCISNDFWSADVDESADTLEKLGQPEIRLDATFRGSAFAASDWVYPHRGLALTVVPETRIVLVRTEFVPCSLAIYRERYRNVDVFREFARP